MSTRKLIALATAAVLIVSTTPSVAEAQIDTSSLRQVCSTPTAVWVRGSGVVRDHREDEDEELPGAVQQFEKYAQQYLGLDPASANVLELGRFYQDGYGSQRSSASIKYKYFDDYAREAGIALHPPEYIPYPQTLTYPAVTVSAKRPHLSGNTSFEDDLNVGFFRNANGAKESLGYGSRYGQSVWQGVAELTHLIEHRATVCSQIGLEPKFVLFGFSQGAQVIGETISRTPDQNLAVRMQATSDENFYQPIPIRDELLANYSLGLKPELHRHVVFSALLGDPKLYLPEGRKFSSGIPACVGQDFSPWRRGVTNCKTNSGSLVARKPYLPTENEPGSTTSEQPAMAQKSGLWCNSFDLVCGSNPLFPVGHKYHNDKARTYSPNGQIPLEEAMIEAKLRLASEVNGYSNPRFIQSSVKAEIAKQLKNQSVSNASSTMLDLMFVVDSTPGSERAVAELKEFIDELDAGKFEQQFPSTQVGLVEYKTLGGRFSPIQINNCGPDNGQSFGPCPHAPLGTDLKFISSKLENMEFFGQVPSRHPAALAGSWVSLTNGTWRPGATKAVILVTNNPYDDPDPYAFSQNIFDDNGNVIETINYPLGTREVVRQHSLEIDPVNFYPVVPHDLAEFYTPLATETSGQVLATNPDSPGSIKRAIATAFDRTQDRPVVKLPIAEYYANPGDEVRFDAGVYSYSPTSDIVRYDYDFDGDGIWDVINGDDIANHVYPVAGDYQMQVRAYDANGLIGSHSVPVHIGTVEFEAPPAAASSFTLTDNDTQAVMSWTADEAPADGWLISSNSAPIAIAAGDLRSFTVTDLDRRFPQELSLTPLKKDKDGSPIYGDSSSDILAPTQIIEIDGRGIMVNSPFGDQRNPNPSTAPSPTTTATPVPTTTTPQPEETESVWASPLDEPSSTRTATTPAGGVKPSEPTPNGSVDGSSLSPGAAAGIILGALAAIGVGAAVLNWPQIEAQLRRIGIWR